MAMTTEKGSDIGDGLPISNIRKREEK